MSDGAAGLVTLEAEIPSCERCPELRAYIATVARVKRRAYRDEPYYGRPVPGFGDPAARLVLVGLAPGAHGSNRTGRMFTGDASGLWLYRALHRAGFANRPESTHASDGLALIDCYITAALRCAPPQNAPTPAQIARCAPYLDRELALLERRRVVVGLGAIGTKAAADALRRAGWTVPPFAFAHGARCEVRRPSKVRVAPAEEEDERVRSSPEITLVASYHPSRQNTNTGRLTEAMFDTIFSFARTSLDDSGPR